MQTGKGMYVKVRFEKVIRYNKNGNSVLVGADGVQYHGNVAYFLN